MLLSMFLNIFIQIFGNIFSRQIWRVLFVYFELCHFTERFGKLHLYSGIKLRSWINCYLYTFVHFISESRFSISLFFIFVLNLYRQQMLFWFAKNLEESMGIQILSNPMFQMFVISVWILRPSCCEDLLQPLKVKQGMDTIAKTHF